MKKKTEIKLWCPKCKKYAEKDEDKSNENWNVYSPNCNKCGSKYDIKIEQETE